MRRGKEHSRQPGQGQACLASSLRYEKCLHQGWVPKLTTLVLTSQCLDKNAGIACLEQAITDIKESISKAGGDCQVKMAPKAVTENDDAELAALMEKRERENQEVSGDEDESTSDEGGVVEADS
jgi:hypothetical protein